MIISINDKPCEAKVGELLLKVARDHRCHIGYVCGGNGICQSCFVSVIEGGDSLSEPNSIEKSFISDKLFSAGGRLACQSVIVREGTIRVLSRAEHLRRIVLGLNVPGFIAYAGTIGNNVADKLPDGSLNLVNRIREGKMSPGDSLGKIAKGLSHASLFTVHTFMETFPFMQYPVSLLADATNGLLSGAADLLCNVSGGLLRLPGATCSCCGTNKIPVIEPVPISVK